MPQPKAQQQPNRDIVAERIVNGADPERFYCPHPGCNRSFAELWRLKVHYRAPPDVRGSGKERGHGTELKWCPKCGKDLKPGKHHVGCSAGKSAPRQAAKRQRQMSTTTESEWVSSEHSDSLEAAVRRQATRRQVTQSEASTGPARQRQQQQQHQQQQQQMQRADSCRLERIKQSMEGGELLFTAAGGPAGPGTTDFGLLMSGIAIKQEQGGADLTIAPTLGGGGVNAAVSSRDSSATAAAVMAAQHAAARPAHGGGEPGVSAFAAAHGGGGSSDDLMDWLRAPSPLLEGADGGGMDAVQQLHAALGGHHHRPPPSALGAPSALDDADALLRVPSPPPLPPDWDPHARTGLLFDFDQFDPSKRAAAQAQRMPSVSAPMMTLTSSMSPQELTNPSDEYIWQILFAGENDPVPKRVTAHLHHHAPDFFDDDPLLDSLLGGDLFPPVHPPHHAGAPPRPALGAGAGGTMPPHGSGGNGSAPVLDAIDAVLAQLHPAPLDSVLPGAPAQQYAAGAQQQPQHAAPATAPAAQEPNSGGTSTDGSLSPDGPHQGGATAAPHPEPVQQVPQAQSPNRCMPYAGAPQPALANGKLKPETATSAGNQCAPSPPRLQQLEIEVAGDFLGGFL